MTLIFHIKRPMDEGNKECAFRRGGWVSVQQDGWVTGAPHITHGGNNGIVCRFRSRFSPSHKPHS